MRVFTSQLYFDLDLQTESVVDLLGPPAEVTAGQGLIQAPSVEMPGEELVLVLQREGTVEDNIYHVQQEILVLNVEISAALRATAGRAEENSSVSRPCEGFVHVFVIL